MDPGEIKKLDETVVNRIAAGEIIQRPANAIKELIENSLDAKSTCIQIITKFGGLKFLQIIDNGTGIRKEDMQIVCNRFTTSKLSNFEDLSKIATFGFRGEALASISHVARLTIQTKTRQEPSAYRCSYEDGNPVGALSPCAGSQGTMITIEDLFYNVPQRSQALKTHSEEFQKIADVIMKYAIHNSNVSFTLKKFGQNPAIRTSGNSKKCDNIRKLYGNPIYQELIEVELKDDTFKFQISGLITSVLYMAKKMIFLLFINNRSVECTSLKAAIDALYGTLLPKGAHPFVYLSVEIDPANVDVNVHPTKHEVNFLNQEDIVERIKEAIEEKILSTKSTKQLYKKNKLHESLKPKETPGELLPKQTSESIRQNFMIRTDARDQKLEKFLKISKSKAPSDVQPKDSYHKTVQLTSVLQMKKDIEISCSRQLRRTIRDMVFVGVVDETYALFQHDVKLYMCNISKWSKELFYQLVIFGFENFKEIRFEPKLPVKDILKVAFESIGWDDTEDGNKDDLAQRATKTLIAKAPIMAQYFSLKIDEDGFLESLPLLLENHQPSIILLPMYLLKLATKVDWETEKDCFESFARETAKYYSTITKTAAATNKYKWSMEHDIFPALKNHLLPPIQLRAHMYELTNLPTLYKVFERC